MCQSQHPIYLPLSDITTLLQLTIYANNEKKWHRIRSNDDLSFINSLLRLIMHHLPWGIDWATNVTLLQKDPDSLVAPKQKKKNKSLASSLAAISQCYSVTCPSLVPRVYISAEIWVPELLEWGQGDRFRRDGCWGKSMLSPAVILVVLYG